MLGAVVTAVLIGSPSPCAQQPERAALSVPQFVAEIEILIARVDASDSAGARAAIIESLPPRWRITDGDREFQFSTAWMTAMLRPTIADPAAWGATRPAVRNRLTVIRDEVAASADPPGRQAHAREALARVLSRPEFQQSAAGRWREDLQRWVGEWLEDLWTRLGGGPGTGRRAGIVLAWIAALGALSALGFWMVRTIAQRKPGTSLGLGAAASRQLRARELALQSLAAGRAGDAREAVRVAYRAALVRLEEQGAWRLDDARTPREYLRLLRASDGRRAPLTDLTRRFEQVWYGNQPAALDDAACVRAHLEELGCLRPGERAI